MRHVGGFDYVIINDVLERALDDLRSILRASQLRLDASNSATPRFSPV